MPKKHKVVIPEIVPVQSRVDWEKGEHGSNFHTICAFDLKVDRKKGEKVFGAVVRRKKFASRLKCSFSTVRKKNGRMGLRCDRHDLRPDQIKRIEKRFLEEFSAVANELYGESSRAKSAEQRERVVPKGIRSQGTRPNIYTGTT